VLVALVEAAQQGDQEAFAALVRTVGDKCMAIAYRMLRDVDRAEDAVQTTFIKAWRQLHTLRDPGRFEAWLHRTLVHECYREARRGRRWGANVRVLELESVSVTNTRDEVLTVQDRDQLDRAFRRLPLDQRAVLVFHEYVGLTVPEVAEHLGIPVGTAKSRLHYAMAALRAAIEADARVTTITRERLA
jgi:RNA polymerase sigma-70 factor (ECF subfamily)